MKHHNKVKRLRARQANHEKILQDLKNDPARAAGYKKPGSIKGK